jgi:hypothetical protein
MLLRRVTKHIQDQNWLAVGLDFLMVMSGVVVGFQITAWNEARQDHQKEHLILERLHADFIAIEQRTSETSEILENRRESATALADMMIGQTQESEPERFRTLLGGSIGTQVPTGRSATYVELLASGEMRLVRSEALRNALVQFDDQVRRQDLAYDTLAAMVIDNAGILLEVQALTPDDSGGTPEQYAAAYERMRTSPEFLVATRLMILVSGINGRWHTDTEAHATQVIEALEAELGN